MSTVMRREKTITYWWVCDGVEGDLPPEMQEALDESAVTRIGQLLDEGYLSGELRDNIRLDDAFANPEDGFECHGWWHVSEVPVEENAITCGTEVTEEMKEAGNQTASEVFDAGVHKALAEPAFVTEEMAEAGRNLASEVVNAKVSYTMKGLGGSKTWGQWLDSYKGENLDLIQQYLNDEIDSVTAIYLAMHRKSLQAGQPVHSLSLNPTPNLITRDLGDPDSQDYTLSPEAESAWITIGRYSLYITQDDVGVSIDAYDKSYEANEALESFTLINM